MWLDSVPLKLIITHMYVTRKYYIHDISTIRSYMDMPFYMYWNPKLNTFTVFISYNILINAMNTTALSMLLLLCIRIHLCNYYSLRV